MMKKYRDAMGWSSGRAFIHLGTRPLRERVIAVNASPDTSTASTDCAAAFEASSYRPAPIARAM